MNELLSFDYYLKNGYKNEPNELICLQRNIKKYEDRWVYIRGMACDFSRLVKLDLDKIKLKVRGIDGEYIPKPSRNFGKIYVLNINCKKCNSFSEKLEFDVQDIEDVVFGEKEVLAEFEGHYYHPDTLQQEVMYFLASPIKEKYGDRYLEAEMVFFDFLHKMYGVNMTKPDEYYYVKKYTQPKFLHLDKLFKDENFTVLNLDEIDFEKAKFGVEHIDGLFKGSRYKDRDEIIMETNKIFRKSEDKEGGYDVIIPIEEIKRIVF
jgi:hypothetical protein